MRPISQITTFPSRTAIAALQSYEQKGRDEADASSRARNCAYAIEAIARQGLLLGGTKGAWHALRCRFQQPPIKRDA